MSKRFIVNEKTMFNQTQYATDEKGINHAFPSEKAEKILKIAKGETVKIGYYIQVKRTD